MKAEVCGVVVADEDADMIGRNALGEGEDEDVVDKANANGEPA